MAEVGKRTGKRTQVGRDVYETSEGEMVSEKSTTFKYKGEWINVPTIFDGRSYDDDTLKMMLDAEVIEPTSTHKNKKDAIKAAVERSESLKFNEGGLATQTKEAFTNPSDRLMAQSDERKLGAGLTSLEFEADMMPLLKKDPIAMLGYKASMPNKRFPSIQKLTGNNTPLYYDVSENPVGPNYNPSSDKVGYGRDYGSSKDVILHELRHRGLKILDERYKEKDSFIADYGGMAHRLLDKAETSGTKSNEFVVELYDNPDATYIKPGDSGSKNTTGYVSDSLQFVDPKSDTQIMPDVADELLGLALTSEDHDEYRSLVGRDSLSKEEIEVGKSGLNKAAIDLLNEIDVLGFDEGGLAQQTEEALGLATPPLGETQEAKDARVKAATSRRPGFRGDGPFDFAGFGSYLKENVSEEELIAGLDNAGEWLVPFYDAGSNMVNVIDEYTKPEEERDYDYIQSELSKAGTSAAAEGAMWLMGGLATKYGIKGVKALSNKAKQYEIDPNSMSAFGVGAIKKKAAEPLEIGFNEALQDGKFLKGYDASTASGMAEKAKNATAGNTRANALMNAAVPEGTRVGVRLNLNSTIPDMPKGLDKLQTLHKGSFSGTAMSYLPFATVRNVTFNVSQKGRTAIASRIKQIDTPEAKSKYPAMSVDGDYVPNKSLLDEGSDLVEIGLNPGVHHLFIDLKTGQAVKGAEEATVIGDRVYAKGVEYWKKAEAPAPLATQSGVDIPSDVRFKFKKGGAVMGKQMEMAFGGSVEEIDPVSGNGVPPGSTPKEVRDDIPAMLSEGEYVVPADVTRFYGVKFFEDLREQAKVELSDMEANGRIGGEPVPEDEDDLTEDEMALLQEVMASSPETMGMFQGGMVNQQTIPSLEQPKPMPGQMSLDLPQPTEYNKPIGMADGGDTKPALDPFGNPIQPSAVSPLPTTRGPMVPPAITGGSGIYGVSGGADTPATTNIPVASSPISSMPKTDGNDKVMKTVFYIHKDGRRLSVLMLGGKPISSVPADFNEFVEDTPENRQKLNFGVADSGVGGVATEGATVSADDTDDEDFKVDIKTKVNPETPEGIKTMYEDSGVNVQDTVAGAKDALDGGFRISKGAGTFLGAVAPGLGLIAGGISGLSQLDALSKANANKNMADFLGDTEASAAIQKEIDNYLKDAPGMVTSLDSVLAKGTERFNNALEAITNINADESVPDIYNDDLNEVGKSNVNEYLLANSAGYAGATIDDSGTIKRVDTSVGSSIRPRLRPDSITDPKATAVTDPKVTSVKTDPKTGEPRKASIAYNPEGKNTSYMDLANSLTPNDGRSYVGGELVDDKTNQPWKAPKKDTVTTTTGRSVVVDTSPSVIKDSSGNDTTTVGAVTSGGQYAGDGFEWKKSENGNYLTRTYTGVNKNATGSSDTSTSTSSSSSSSGGYSCYVATALKAAGYWSDTKRLKLIKHCMDTKPESAYLTKVWRNGYVVFGKKVVAPFADKSLIRWLSDGYYSASVEGSRSVKALLGLTFFTVPSYTIGFTKAITRQLVDIERT